MTLNIYSGASTVPLLWSPVGSAWRLTASLRLPNSGGGRPCHQQFFLPEQVFGVAEQFVGRTLGWGSDHSAPQNPPLDRVGDAAILLRLVVPRMIRCSFVPRCATNSTALTVFSSLVIEGAHDLARSPQAQSSSRERAARWAEWEERRAGIFVCEDGGSFSGVLGDNEAAVGELRGGGGHFNEKSASYKYDGKSFESAPETEGRANSKRFEEAIYGSFQNDGPPESAASAALSAVGASVGGSPLAPVVQLSSVCTDWEFSGDPSMSCSVFAKY
ncbi:hypothetical protein FB45DRAFT_866677 [Roridomyces roridus]|uniref:Uncharacterized protein n=1 Tax=Roridomyces roridus TaxID=1738132 RepID=A0AAD7FRJ1_9AGAR|nr:hypothetical protein FB45DRAFT_866677 [Roridomyces roridus]